MAWAPEEQSMRKRAPALGGRTAWAVLAVGQFAAVIAVLQRSSLGVAATDAYARFGIAAATLGAFTVVQLVIYAVMQVPVGVLIDRYGSKRLIIAGSLAMAGAQAMFAAAHSLPLAFAARAVLGIGDALTFISVMRLVPAWFPPQPAERSPWRSDRSTSWVSSCRPPFWRLPWRCWDGRRRSCSPPQPAGSPR